MWTERPTAIAAYTGAFLASKTGAVGMLASTNQGILLADQFSAVAQARRNERYLTRCHILLHKRQLLFYVAHLVFGSAALDSLYGCGPCARIAFFQ